MADCKKDGGGRLDLQEICGQFGGYLENYFRNVWISSEGLKSQVSAQEQKLSLLEEKLLAIEKKVENIWAFLIQGEMDENVDPHEEGRPGAKNFSDLRRELKDRYDRIMGHLLCTTNYVRIQKELKKLWDGNDPPSGEWKKIAQYIDEIKEHISAWEKDSGCACSFFWPERDCGVKKPFFLPKGWEVDEEQLVEVAEKQQNDYAYYNIAGASQKRPNYSEYCSDEEKTKYLIAGFFLPAILSQSSQSTRVVVPARVLVCKRTEVS